MKLRWTKKRLSVEEGILQTYGLREEFAPGALLLESMAIKLSDARKDIAAYKSRSVLRAIWQDMFR
jgi:hypothetical protein